MEWEEIDENHHRAKVHGGWLVKTYESVFHQSDINGMQDGWDWRVAMAFVPDPNHEWKIGDATPTPTKQEMGL